jgi:hypothetical protein
MATTDPTGGGPVVALSIPPDDAAFLRGVFEMAQGGIRDELAEYPDSLREPTRLHREDAAYDALLAVFDSGSIVVTGDIRCVLCDLAQLIDRINEYERVAAEHAALLGLPQASRSLPGGTEPAFLAAPN